MPFALRSSCTTSRWCAPTGRAAIRRSRRRSLRSAAAACRSTCCTGRASRRSCCPRCCSRKRCWTRSRRYERAGPPQARINPEARSAEGSLVSAYRSLASEVFMRIAPFSGFLAAALLVAPPLFAQALGAAAPAFTLTDTVGKTVKLSDYRGKFVVLEWTNPECPFVRKHYNSQNMQGLQKEWGAKDVVWLTINSTNASHSEYKTPDEMAKWMTAQQAAPKATLIDGTSGTA